MLGAGENMADKEGGIERRTSMAEAFRVDDVEALPERVRAFREMADAIRADREARAPSSTPRGPTPQLASSR